MQSLGTTVIPKYMLIYYKQWFPEKINEEVVQENDVQMATLPVLWTSLARG